jgi:hypothetical protein
VVFHWFVAPTLDETKARSALFSWMSGSQTVKDLDKKSRVTAVNFCYFPLWYMRWQAGSREETGLQPAAATSVTELTSLNLPAGDLRKYSSSLDAQAEPPSVPLETALAWFKQRKTVSEVREMALVHVPTYTYKYQHAGKSYTAVVDGASGRVMANIFPAKAEIPYQLVGGVTALVYLCLALFPLGGALGGSDGSFTGIGLCIGLGVLAAPLLLGWALWVASKV